MFCSDPNQFDSNPSKMTIKNICGIIHFSQLAVFTVCVFLGHFQVVVLLEPAASSPLGGVPFQNQLTGYPPLSHTSESQFL